MKENSIKEDIEILEEFIECSKDIINDMEYVRPIDVTITVDDIQAIENLINRNKEIEKKDKIIDLMAEYISNITYCSFESEGKYLDCEKMCNVRTDKECWKQYFERKVEDVKN